MLIEERVHPIPIPLRRLFLRERRLLGILTRSAYETVWRCFGVLLGEKGGRPGMVAALQTFGSKSPWNPHVHSLLTDGLLFPGGEFHPMKLWDEETFADLRGSGAGAGSSGDCDRSERVLTETFRRLVLDALVAEDRLSPEFRDKLLTGATAGASRSTAGI